MVYGPGVMYFVEGLTSWPKEMINKQISVKGRLITYTTTHNTADNSVVPQYMPVMKVLKRAKYHVVE